MRTGFALVLSIFTAGASAQNAVSEDRHIEGEVFIVTQGTENVRLGLVEIKILSEQDITNHVANRLKLAPTEIPKYDDAIQNIEESIQDTKANIEAEKKLVKEYSQKVGEDLVKRGQESIKVSEASLATLESIRAELLQKKNSWPDADYFFKEMPGAKYSSRTDADGKFRIAIPRSKKFAIAARASRKISEKSSENYFWLVWVPAEESADTKFLLSNHNLVTSGSKESVVSTRY